MLQAPVQPLSYSLRERRKSQEGADLFEEKHRMADVYEDDAGGGGKNRSKSRRELPPGAVATLKAWLLSPEHFSHPYPTPQDQEMLMQKTGIDKKQLKNWFTNARRRIWKPMLKKQIESGQLTAAGAPGAVPGLMLTALPGAVDNPHSVSAIRVHYQQAVSEKQEQGDGQAVPLDSFGNPIFGGSYSNVDSQHSQLASVGSLGTLPRQTSNIQLSKTDSHAVLMELFARDQDLVRQATESARLKAEAKIQPPAPSPSSAQSGSGNQHPMKNAVQVGSTSSIPGVAGSLPNVPTMNSWPHFSSITSLNNLGTIPGVKSITSLSGQDLASKGAVNRKGNLAQVKSVESMGKNDSYAFLEVFFGDKNSSSANMSAYGAGSSGSKGGKLASEEDNEIGLSLEDESPSQPTTMKAMTPPGPLAPPPPKPAPMAPVAVESSSTGSGTLKRAYDDALAARGLMSVSRSSEKLTDLVLPDKIQRTLSQEFINKDKSQVSSLVGLSVHNQESPPVADDGTQARETQKTQTETEEPDAEAGEPDAETGGHVEVPTSTKCALCGQTNVDTQLRPCGHMFHERCLKPSLKTPHGPPRCPVDHTPMHSAVLAIPTDGKWNQPREANANV